VNQTTGVVTINKPLQPGSHPVSVTATDNCGAASTRAFDLIVDRPPTINGQSITLEQGSSSANLTIANVNDAEDPENTLIVKVNGNSSATSNGVSVSGLNVSATGAVTANVAATCSALNASFTLVVTDSNGLSNSDTLNVMVKPNTPPKLGNYPSAGTINLGASTTVTPNAAPSDNGLIISLTASAPGFAGSLGTNLAAGAVTISNAGPAGIYTVTVKATDNCGATSTRTFTLRVNGPPTITGEASHSHQGSPQQNGLTIAFVNDDLDAKNTLTVKVNGSSSATVNGVTVSGLNVNSSGEVRANVVAACNASSSTFTLTVTDSGGLSANGSLSAFVSLNTPPALGSYPSTTIRLINASSATVAPNGPPWDNGSIVSLTASAAGFTGSFSVNPGGVVHISNAGPLGDYTVTVTARDNCGAISTSTFRLTVSAF
jgi:hypothetical protein